MRSGGPGQGGAEHVGGARGAQGTGALGDGGAGGDHVVDEEDPPSGHQLRVRGLIGPQYVGPAGSGSSGEAGLGLGIPDLPQSLHSGDSGTQVMRSYRPDK